MSRSSECRSTLRVEGRSRLDVVRCVSVLGPLGKSCEKCFSVLGQIKRQSRCTATCGADSLFRNRHLLLLPSETFFSWDPNSTCATIAVVCVGNLILGTRRLCVKGYTQSKCRETDGKPTLRVEGAGDARRPRRLHGILWAGEAKS